jgi:ABC-type nitrate/sulfonate/bicarbonate transport system substrate-binding protein
MARAGALLGTVLLIAACSGAATPSAAPSAAAPSAEAPSTGAVGAPEKTTLKVVQGSDPDFTQVALTKAIEYMKDKGVTVEFSSVVDTDTATRSVIAGQQDVVVNSLYFGINANQQGIPLRTFLNDIQAVDYLLMSVPDVTDVNQLVPGGTVGINKPGDLGATIADQCLKFSDVDVDQVEYVQVGGTSARMAALLAGQIQAAPAHAAEALNAQKEGGLNILVDCGEAIGTFLQTGASSTQEWLDANPNLAQLFTDAYIDALRWAQTNKDEYIELSKTVVPDLDDQIRSDTYDLLVKQGIFATDGGLTPEAVQKLVDIGLDSASISGDIPEEWVTYDYVNSYLDRNGEFSQ